MANWIIPRKVDLSKTPDKEKAAVYALAYPGDNAAHTWRVEVYDNGEPVSIEDGNISGYFLRPDGETVTMEGAAVDNVAIVSLPQEVYAYTGMVKAGMRLTYTYGRSVTLDAILINVLPTYDSGTYVDPGEAIPTIADLLAQISAMQAATTEAEAAATKAVRYDSAQSLTTAQKAQALSNLGLTAVDDGEGNISFS